MARKTILAKLLLYPFSLVYGAVVGVRNKLFDFGILKQQVFDVPVIVVGNISAGGTGKTPHVEYILDLLRKDYKIAVLSRGYKRKSKGFVLASEDSTPLSIGDEPYQIFRKFGNDVTVAVCENRVKGITEILTRRPEVDLIVLDDAFQHRYVKPTASVVVMEYDRPVFDDHLLPYGRLRESRKALHRADIVVVSKCHADVNARDIMLYRSNLDLFPFQKSFFSRMKYGELQPVFPKHVHLRPPSLEWLTRRDMILTVAGIGNPKPFVRYVKSFEPRVWVNVFPDHHNFNSDDITLILNRFRSMKAETKYIVTTEKDAVRLANMKNFPKELKPYIFYLPINVELIKDDDSDFQTTLLKTIRDNRKNLSQ